MLVAIALLVLAIILLLVLVVRKRRVDPEAPKEEPAGAPEPEVVTVDFTRPGQAMNLRAAFNRGLRDLRRHLGRDARYRLPWYLLIGEAASGKSSLLGRAGLSLPAGEPPETSPDEGPGCCFWLLDGGVVLDVAGDFVLGPGGRGNAGGWKLLLQLLRSHRPERPLDGVVLAIPAAGLLADGPAAIAEKADGICGRLREAQRELGMAFPVYALVTGCDRVPGFSSLFREVPEEAHGEIFGWSSPYGLETPFRAEWVDEAFQTVGASLKKVQLQILGERIQIDEPDGVFLFPTEVQALRDPLRALLGQVFRPNTLVDPLALRGLYFCGELKGEAIESNAHAPAPALLARGWSSAWRDASSRVLFLRDLFARKVFPERGLARFSSRTLAGRNRLVLAAQVGLVVLTLATSLGVWWGHTRLSQRERELKVFLLDTSRDIRETRERRAAGEDLTEPYLEEKSLRFLAGLARIDASWYGSVFVPSSWFSSFRGDFKQALVAAYDEIVFNALSLQLDNRASELIQHGRPARLEEAVVPLTDDLADLAAMGTDGGSGLGAGSEAYPLSESEDPAGAEDLGEDMEEETLEITLGAPEILPVEATPELVTLRDYVARLAELERKARSFNGLKDTRDLRELADLVRYLFGAAVPQGFFENAGTYQRALRLVHYKPFDAKTYQAEASLTAGLLADQLFDRLYRRNALTFYLQTLQSELDQIGAAQEGNISRARLLRELTVAAEQTEQALARPELAWTASPTFNLGPPVDKILDSVRTSAFLGPLVEQEIREKGQGAAVGLDQALASYQSAYTGPLLRRDAPGKPWKLAPAVLVLRTALADLLNESFMNLRTRRRIQTDIAPGTRLLWDTRQLQEAVRLYDPYKAFVEGGLRRFPASLRDSLQRSARIRLSDKMMEQVAEAQRFRAVAAGGEAFLEREIQTEVENFRLAHQPLTDLISIFDRIGSPEDHELLERLTFSQAQDLLRSVDRLLDLEEPYEPRDGGFEWWEGGRSVAFEAYGVGDAEELAAYLEAQRARVAFIAEQYADPALRVLGTSPRDPGLRALVNKWSAILSELRKYDSKKPGNSVANLETWIAGLPEMDSRSCLKSLAPKRLDQRPPDFFLQVRAGLRRQLFARCQELAQGQALTGYQAIATAFNQRLAGRFPFTREVPGPLDREAEPADLRAFFKVFDAQAGTLEGLPEGDPRFGDQEEEIRAFLERMRRVRELFASFLDDPKRPEVPTFDFEIDFRTNTRREQGGNQIIRWEMAAGDERLARWTAPELRGRWTLGEPVRLTLHWAKDALDVPLPPADKAAEPRMRVEGRTVSYTYGGRWSLFSLLRERAGEPTDFEGGEDPHPQTLRFAIETGPAPALDGNGEEKEEKEKKASLEPDTRGEVRVFVRVTLMATEKKDKEETRKEIELPEFPQGAPVLGAQMAGGDGLEPQGSSR